MLDMNTTKPILFAINPNIPPLVREGLAKNYLANSRLVGIKQLQHVMSYRMPLLISPFLLQLTQVGGLHTLVEYSVTVPHLSIIRFCLWEWQTSIGSAKIHGELHGESKASFD